MKGSSRLIYDAALIAEEVFARQGWRWAGESPPDVDEIAGSIAEMLHDLPDWAESRESGRLMLLKHSDDSLESPGTVTIYLRIGYARDPEDSDQLFPASHYLCPQHAGHKPG